MDDINAGRLIDELIRGARYDGLGYETVKDINMRLVWLRALLGDYEIEVMPPHVQICSSYACNYQCRFCGGHGISDAQHEKLNKAACMSGARLEDMLRETLPYAYTWTSAASGEFFCQPGIADMLDIARPYRARASVTSNGAAVTPEKTAAFMSNACSLRVSMASAVADCYEFFHRHGSFARVCNNIRTLTRANELLPADMRVGVGMYGPILVSTVRDLAHRVRVARDLGMEAVGSTSFLLQVDLLAKSDKRWLNECMELYPGLWNYWRAAAGAECAKLNISDYMHRPFAGVDPECYPDMDEDGLMFPRIDKYIASEPPVVAHLDAGAIERNAAWIAGKVRDAHASLGQRSVGEMELAAEMRARLRSILEQHRSDLIRMAGDKSIRRICWRLDLNANILPGPYWRPCCVAKQRYAMPTNAPVRVMYNSAEMRKFCGDTAAGELPADCRGCRDLARVTRARLFEEALQLGLIGDTKRMYDSARDYEAE